MKNLKNLNALIRTETGEFMVPATPVKKVLCTALFSSSATAAEAVRIYTLILPKIQANNIDHINLEDSDLDLIKNIVMQNVSQLNAGTLAQLMPSFDETIADSPTDQLNEA